jgi:hypothetical protein
MGDIVSTDRGEVGCSSWGERGAAGEADELAVDKGVDRNMAHRYSN